MLSVGDFPVAQGPEGGSCGTARVPPLRRLAVPWLGLTKRRMPCWLSFLQAGVMVLLAQSSLLVTQQSVGNSVFLNRSTWKTSLPTDESVEVL